VRAVEAADVVLRERAAHLRAHEAAILDGAALEVEEPAHPPVVEVHAVEAAAPGLDVVHVHAEHDGVTAHHDRRGLDLVALAEVD
jgi:hypothetical protein